MGKKGIETLVGLFVLLGLCAFAFLALKAANLGSFSSSGATYALTSDSRPVAGCDSLPLGAMRYRATASPDFVARHFADGVSAGALLAAPSLSFNAKDMLQLRWAQALTGRL